MRQWGKYLLFLLLVASLAQADNFLDPRRYLKKILENQLSAFVGKTVSIGELRGNLYSRLIVRDVEISESDGQNAVLISRAEITYNLKDILLQRFDVVSNIHSVIVSDAYLLVKRDRLGAWNYVFTAAEENTEKTDKPKKKPVPKMQITIVNAGMRFIDERGWGKQALSRRYDQRINNFNGTVRIDGEEILFTAAGTVSRNTALNISGKYAKDYSVNISAQRVDLAEHGFYALSFSDYTLNNGRADLAVKISGAENSTPNFEATAQISNVDFQPGQYLEAPLENITGVLRWRDNRLEMRNLHASLLETPLTLNGTLLLDKTPRLDLQAALQDFDFQKKYSRHFHLPETEGRGALTLALQGPLDNLSGSGNLLINNFKYDRLVLEKVEADAVLQNGQGEVTFRLLDNIEGIMVFEGDWQNLDSTISLNADGVHIAISVQKDAKQNIFAHIDLAQFDFAANNLLQTYFPDSAGQIELSGDLSWQNGRLSANGLVQTSELDYADLQITTLNGRFALNEQEFILEDFQLGLADSALYGQTRINLVSGNEPLLQRLDIDAEIFTEVDLAKMYDFSQQVSVIYFDLRKRLLANHLAYTDLKKAALPDGALYEEYGESALSKFQEFIPTVSTENMLAKLDIAGFLSGHIALRGTEKDFRLEQDWLIRDGKIQGQSARETHITAVTDRGNTVSVNIMMSDLQMAGTTYDNLHLGALLNSGNLYFEDLSVVRGRHTTQHLLTGTFPVFSLWNDSYAPSLNLRLRLSGENLALFTPFLPSLEIASSGNIDITLHGTLQNPLLSAEHLDLTDTCIALNNQYIQEIQIRRADLGLTANDINITNLEVRLRSGKQYTPLLKLSGHISLSDLNLLQLEQLVLRNNLTIKDTEGQLNIRNLYNGNFALRNASFSGDLPLPLNAKARTRLDKQIRTKEPLGPLLTGTVSFSNGTLYLMQSERPANTKTEKTLSVRLNLDMNIQNNLRVMSTDSLLASNFLGQINVGLRDNNPLVKINGSTNYPRIDGRIYLDEGYVSFIDRKFNLLSTREQERYFQANSTHRPQDNYIELAETEQRAIEPVLRIVAQTTVYDTQTVSGSALTDLEESESEARTITTETDYLVFIDGPIFDLSSITFEKYKREYGLLALDGEPYVLKDKNTGQTIDQYRFQELTYALSPPLLRSMLNLAQGAEISLDEIGRDAVRDLTISEINILARTLLKPVERSVAEQAGLYDVRIKRNFGQDAVNLAGLSQQAADPAYTDEETEQPLVENLFGLELVKELWRERLYFSLDTSFDRNMQSKNINITVHSYKLNYKILKNYFVDELSLNIGEELDILQEEYVPVLSLELLHSF